jgi:phosphoglycolate phosphatase
MIKCCIFDLDGTVLDTISTITYFVSETFSKHAISAITEDACKYFAGDGARNLIKRALASKGIEDSLLVDSILAEYIDAYDKNPLHLTRVFTGIEDMLLELKSRGIKLALLSNKPDEAVKNIVSHFFEGIFDEASGAKESVPLKPDPTSAKDILRRLGISESETAFVGDTSTDIKTAKNLGCALSIGVLWGFRERLELCEAGADVTVSSPDGILWEVQRVV